LIKKEWLDSIFALNPWYYELRKEVRKRMAIDYREEWEKFRVYYGGRRVESKQSEVGAGVSLTLGSLMNGWIRDIIDSREKLMEEFVKSRMSTDIVEGRKDGYLVGIWFKGGPMYGKVSVTRKEFHSWLKREKGKEVK